MNTSPLLAHGLGGRVDLPIPMEAFYWAAGVILVVSFVLLGWLWKEPRWQQVPWRPLSPGLTRITDSDWLLWPLRLLVLAALLLVFVAAAVGSEQTNRNIAPVFVFALWWIGLVPLALLFGNVWRALNPWASLARLAQFEERVERSWPRGVWAAFLVLAAFVWLELVYPTPTNVRLMAVLIALYSVVTIAGMGLVGIRRWLDHGEGFTVYSTLMASMSPWERRRGPAGQERLGIRPPFLGTLQVRPSPGLVPLVALLIGSVSFDGLERTGWWDGRVTNATQTLTTAGVEPHLARYAFGTFGLVLLVLLAWAAFELASFAAARAGRFGAQEPRHPVEDTPGSTLALTAGQRSAAVFAPTLLPIAVAYVVAHYFSFFVFQPLDLIRLASDPLGRGWDLFGTGGFRLQDYYSLLSAEAIWLVQVGAIVVGHVVSLTLAHERATQLAPDAHRAMLSQLPMLGLMVLYTVGGLYFLSTGLTS